MDSLKSRALAYHEYSKPEKLSVESSKPCVTQEDLSLAYTPGVDVFDIEINAPSIESFIETVVNIASTFGGINLEDIAVIETLAEFAHEAVLKAYNLTKLSFGKNYIIPKLFDPRLIERIPPRVTAAATQKKRLARGI